MKKFKLLFLFLMLTVFSCSESTDDILVNPSAVDLISEYLTELNIPYEIIQSENAKTIEFEIPNSDEVQSSFFERISNILVKTGYNPDLSEHNLFLSNARVLGCTNYWRFRECITDFCDMIVTTCSDCSGEWECMITYQ